MFFPTVIYPVLFITYFFVPGFLITVILGFKKLRFLLSFALSYALLVLTLLPFEYYAQPIVRWQWCVLLEWVILAVLVIIKTLVFSQKDFSASIRSFMNSRLCLPRLLVPLALAGIICGYLAYAGPYLEIPADAWEHMSRFLRHKSSFIDNSAFPSGLSFVSLFLMQGNYCLVSHWHFIHAWLCHVSGLVIMDSIYVLTFINVLTFLLAIYYFGLYLFAGLRISAPKKMIMAALAVLFAAATMGNMVFAYIRYYAFAPTILNYVLFLTAMAVIFEWLRSNRWLGHALWIASVLLIVTNAVHTQEALFIFFMTLALSLLGALRTFWRTFFSRVRHSRNQNVIPASLLRRSKAPSCEGRKAGIQVGVRWIPIFMGMTKRIGGTAGRSIYGSRWTVSEWKNMIMAGILLLVFFAWFFAIRHVKPDPWISPYMIMPNVGISMESVNFIFRSLIISVPENPYLRLAVYQLFIFYQVVGCWGLFVYLLFGIMIRRFVKLPYLIAGMLIVPLLTVFNPFTIDPIVRMGQDVTSYRFIYLIPLPFVGGYLLVHFWGKAREWFHRLRTTPAESVASIWPRLTWFHFIGCILVLAGLIGLILPINAAGIYAPYSKIYTLRKIPAGNDYHLFNDLGKILMKYENKVILMDGWTSGYVTFYSPKNTYCHAKWLNSSTPENEPPDPYTWENLHNRGLIVINRRNGDLSIPGRIAKHWPEDVLPKVSRNYSLEAQYYLESHPDKFQKIWSRNRIAIYAVR